MFQLRPLLVASLALSVLACKPSPAAKGPWEKCPELQAALVAPDLSPLLTKDETTKIFQQWNQELDEGYRQSEGRALEQWKKDFTAARFKDAQADLVPLLPKASSITFYSLIPRQGRDIRDHYGAARAAEIEKLPVFHGYHVLGSVTLTEAEEPSKWMRFLRTQVWPGFSFACDFQPRHGFRFSSHRGDMDMLVCFECNQFSIPGGISSFSNPRKPIFSTGAQNVVDALFDKKGIERDESTH
jgi:hypothetical protein